MLTSIDVEKVGLKKIASYIRGHWQIENRLHRVRDGTMNEDACKAGKGNAAQSLAALRNTVLNLFRLKGVENVAKEIRRNRNHQKEYEKYLLNSDSARNK